MLLPPPPPLPLLRWRLILILMIAGATAAISFCGDLSACLLACLASERARVIISLPPSTVVPSIHLLNFEAGLMSGGRPHSWDIRVPGTLGHPITHTDEARTVFRLLTPPLSPLSVISLARKFHVSALLPLLMCFHSQICVGTELSASRATATGAASPPSSSIANSWAVDDVASCRQLRDKVAR